MNAIITTRKGRPEFGPWPLFGTEEIAAVARVLESGKVNYWTGAECRQFEKEYAAALGVKYAVALANGTVALELALVTLNLAEGDEVIVTPRSFIASASSAVLRGLTPVFADVDINSQNITAETIAPKITPRTKAIIAVHLAGWPCEMSAILDLADHHGIAVIEDCAQAHGAMYKGNPVGSFGRINAFSFCQDKIISTGGEGGLVSTNEDALWERAWSYKDHGKSWDAVYQRTHPIGFRWLHEDFGTNWRMMEIQGALGRIALHKLPASVETRRRNAQILNDAFSELSGLRVTMPPAHVYHSYYRYYVFLRPESLRAGWTRERIMGEISEAGVPVSTGTCGEIYLEKAFTRRTCSQERLPIAADLSETSLVFLVHPTISRDAMYYTAEICTRVLKTALR